MEKNKNGILILKAVDKKRTKNNKLYNYERAGILSLNEVFPNIGKKNHKFCIGNKLYNVHLNSTRYRLFKLKGIVCVKCGLVGTHFAIERNPHEKGSFHLNLYGTLPNGVEILMTKDHTIPKSKGGPNTLDNLETMCSICNGKKADKCE